jgi:uncharacterized protein (DUF302 family)
MEAAVRSTVAPSASIRLSVELPSQGRGTIGDAARERLHCTDPLHRGHPARMQRMLRHGQRVACPADLFAPTLPEHTIRTGGMMATASIAENAGKGIVTVASTHSGDETAERLQTLILERGLTIFARIDFRGDAERAGLAMQFSRLVIFGNPKAGTPLMQLAPTAALDLPLKVLVWEDADGRAWLSFNSTDYLRERHGLPDDLMKPVSGVAALVDAAAR